MISADRYADEKREAMPRNVSQGRGVAQKISTTADRSRDKRLDGGNSGILSSTSMGKFQIDTYNVTQKSATNLMHHSPVLQHAQTINIPSSSYIEKADSPNPPLQLRSLSKGRTEIEQHKLKNNYFNYTAASPIYSASAISNTDLSKKIPDEYGSPGESTAHKYTKSQISSQSQLPPKQLYPLLQSSQQSPEYEIAPPAKSTHHPLATPTSLSSTLRSQQGHQSASHTYTHTHQHTQHVDHSQDHSYPHQSPQPSRIDDDRREHTPEGQMTLTTDNHGLQSSANMMLAKNLKAKVVDLEKSNDMLEKKCQVMQQAVKELKKENTKLKAALEGFRGKDAIIENLTTEKENFEKELEERKGEASRAVEGYEALKNEILDLARFIRSQVRPNWVVNSIYLAKFPKRGNFC